MGLFPVDEIKRKAFHLLTLIYILAYWFLPFGYVAWGMGIVVFIVAAGETVRLKVPSFNAWILKVLGGVHRQQEEGKVSGLPWTLSGSFLTMLIFKDKRVVLLSLLYLAIGDAFAALFGRRFGRHKIIGGKTLEGSLACLCVCFLIGFLFLDWKMSLVTAVFVTILELIPWPLNDNFWMPLFSAAFLAFLVLR
jgi:dolichol kinase